MKNFNLKSFYLEKQNKFISLVKEIQTSLNSKEYKKLGYSFKDFIKMKWNISQAQAYRYLLCAKVIDQLKEFEIKPSYERLCKTLFSVAKTPIQMKLLWSTILKKADGKPDNIITSNINKYWSELCMNKKYSHICHYEDDIISKVEKSLNKLSNDKKHKQIQSFKSQYKLKKIINTSYQESIISSPTTSEPPNSINTSLNNFQQELVIPSPTASEPSSTTYNNTSSNISQQESIIPSPNFSESSNIKPFNTESSNMHNSSSNTSNFPAIYISNGINNNYTSLSPISNCVLSPKDEIQNSERPFANYNSIIVPYTESVGTKSNNTFYYIPVQNQLSYQYQQPSLQLAYL